MDRLQDHRTRLRRIITPTPGRREIHVAGLVIVWTTRKVRGRLVEEFDLPPGARIETKESRK